MRALRVALYTVRIALVCVWIPFVVWLFLYNMPLSGLHALIGGWALWPSRGPATGGRSLAAVTILLLGVLTVPLVGLPEYAATTNHLHCRALGFMGSRAPTDCLAEDVEDGASIAKAGGALLSEREHLGVLGFNTLLALGGVLVGFPEVAKETLWMAVEPDPFGETTAASTAERRQQCSAKSRHMGEGVLWEDDLPMRSTKVRQKIAEALPRLPSKPGSILSLGEIHFTSGGRNNSGYLTPLLQDSIRVALALEVGDSRLSLQRQPTGSIQVDWEGTINYPGSDISFSAPLPTIFGWRTLRVSETIFCGMAVDGVMNPYPLTYRWIVTEDDPRLSPEGKRQSERGWLEAGLGTLLSLSGG